MTAGNDDKAPVVPSGPTSSMDASTPTDASRPMEHSSFEPTKLERLGVEVELPAGATWAYRPDESSVEISFEGGGVAHLTPVSGVPPVDLDAAMRDETPGKDSRTLLEGKTDDGVLYQARTFQVRVGSPGGGAGQRRHRWEHVSRVHGFLPLDGKRYIKCKVFIEHGLDITDEDPSIQRGLRLCTSMRGI